MADYDQVQQWLSVYGGYIAEWAQAIGKFDEWFGDVKNADEAMSAWLEISKSQTAMDSYNTWAPLYEQQQQVALAGEIDTPEEAALLEQLSGYLQSWGLHSQEALDFIKDAILDRKTGAEILLDLYETDFFKTAFPEVELRKQAGLSFMEPALILEYRDRAKSSAKEILGVEVNNDQIAQLIGGGVSIDEFRHRLDVRKKVNELGGGVKDFFNTYLGIPLDDQGLQDFFDPEVDTSDWDRAYEDAIYRGFLSNLGVAVNVSQEMADQLRSRGIGVDQAVESYKQLAQNLPAIEKLYDIDHGVSTDTNNPYDSFGAAFGAFATLDAESQLEIARLFANETARFSQQGGIAGGGQGLLTRHQRAKYR